MIAIVVTTYFVRRATIDIAAAVRGKKPPTWAGRRGFTGYVADLWDDAWEDARATHKRKRDTREATPAGQGRPAGFKRWFAAQWAAGWERLEAAHHAKRAGRAARPDPDEAAYPDPPKGAEYPESGPCQWCGKPAVTKVGRAGYGHIDPRTGLPGCDGVNFPDVTDPEYEEFPEDLIRPCPHCDGVQLPVIGTEGVDEDGRGTALVTCGKCGATDVGSWSTTDPDAPYEWVDSPPATTVTPPEYELYEGQSSHADTATGIPLGLTGQDCDRDGCDGIMRAEPGTQHFAADGTAMVNTVCTKCRMQSPTYWNWTGTPPSENEHYVESDEEDDANDKPLSKAVLARLDYDEQKCRAARGFDDNDVVDAEIVDDDPPHRLQPAAGSPPYVHAERDGKALGVVHPIRSTSTQDSPNQEEHSMAEVTGLASAIAFADQMHNSYGPEVAAGLEAFQADLEGIHGVSGEAVNSTIEGIEHLQAASAAFGRVRDALIEQQKVAEAYAATPGAGTRDFVTAE